MPSENSMTLAVWAALGTVGAFILAVLKMVFSLSGRITAAEIDARRADAMAAAALGKVELLGTRMHEESIETAKAVADTAAKAERAIFGLAAAEQRFARAIETVGESLGERLDHLTDRLDRLLERNTE